MALAGAVAACGTSSSSDATTTGDAPASSTPDATQETTASDSSSSDAPPSSEDARPAELTKVNYSTSFLAFGWDAPFYLAKERGYFEDEGLDVTIRQGKGSADAIKTLLGGANDLVSAERTAMAIQATETPGLKAVAGITFTNGQMILSYKDSNITKPEDLVGKTLAVSLGSSEAGVIPEFLRLAGVDPADVQIENVGTAQKAQFLKTRTVDAIVWNDFSAIGIDALDKFNMIMLADYGMNQLGNGIIATEKWAEKNPEAVEGFVAAVARAWNDMVKDPNPGIQNLVKESQGLSEGQALTQWQLYLAESDFQGNPWGWQTEQRWSDMLSSVKGAGVIESPQSPDYYFTHDYIRKSN
jgi:NitT/TauT family transport system substrate-binding protein